MYLVIVESPAKARTIKKFLGRKYKVEASMGHVIDLPRSQFGIDVEKEFQPKYITIRGKGQILKKLKAEGQKAEKVYFAADPDREGEAICWHLMRALKVKEDEPCRVEFHEITSSAVKNAFKQPRQIDQNRVDAQQARRILDRLVGYNISPLLWKKVKKGLSAGRVQSLAMRLICDREEEIRNFEPEEYWSLVARLTPRLKKEAFPARFLGTEKKKVKLSEEKQVQEILEALDQAVYQVKKVVEKDRRRNPAPPFITSSLQQDASRRINFNIRKTMSVAQSLYEGVKLAKEGTVGLITYMRTDSTQVSETAREEARQYILDKYGKDYYPPRPRVYKSKKGAQEAHEAIRPTSVFRTPEELQPELTRDQYRLYRLIWERFVASQMSSALFKVVTADITAASYHFRANGSTLQFPGFLILYDDQVKEDREEDRTLPELAPGQELKLLGLEPQQHFTQPPPRYTEATLVKTLEEKGIGRPSTYAPTIGTIQARNYVEKEKKAFVPTELGEIVTGIMKDFFPDIVDIQFTASLEEKLDQVEEGKTGWIDVLDHFYGPFHQKLTYAEKELQQVEVQDEVSEVECEKCGRMMVYKMGRYGKFLACPGFPECRNTRPILKETGVKCPYCQGGNVVEKRTKKGRVFFGCSTYPDCQFVSWNPPVNQKCPECGEILVEKKSKKGASWECLSKECNYRVTGLKTR